MKMKNEFSFLRFVNQLFQMYLQYVLFSELTESVEEGGRIVR